MSPKIHGYCAPQFKRVKATFEQNFSQRGEIGASLCLQVNNETVVDLWAGMAIIDDPDTNGLSMWDESTISLVFSCTKAATALCAHILIDRGQLELDKPVADYWPAFAAAGKSNITVKMLLGHSSALPALREPVKAGGFYDFDYMTQRLAAEPPFWEPGTDNGYHMVTFGWLIGELIRRISGQSLGAFFQTEIAQPLGLDFHIGLNKNDFPRTSKMKLFQRSPADPISDFTKALLTDQTSLQFLALLNTGGYAYDDPQAWQAEIGGAGGIANARALAAMFAPLASRCDKTYLSEDRIKDMAAPISETQRDKTLLIPSRFAQGFMVSTDNRDKVSDDGSSFIIGAKAFGHVGMGGSTGFADPDCGLGFGYTMNNMGGGILLNERGQSVVDAAYQCLGYTHIQNGCWQR